ncbi:MAG: helix-turn-helix domain-containing protein [archaeon]
MKLTKTQLDILHIVYTRGSLTSKEAALQLNNSHPYASKLISDLKEKGFLKKVGIKYLISDNIYAYALRNLILEYPKTDFKQILADSRLDVLLHLLDKRSMNRIESLSGLSKPLIYIYLKDFLRYGIIIKEGRYYRLNKSLWPQLIDFLESYSRYKGVVGYNLPPVYREIYRSKTLMMLEVPRDLKVDEKTASLTAFSQFHKYGIALRLTYNYYSIPKENLNINDIFAHSILCSSDMRKKMFTILFYLKNKGSLDIEYIDRKYRLEGYISKIRAIIGGETLKDYPAPEEIKQKAKLYDIRY